MVRKLSLSCIFALLQLMLSAGEDAYPASFKAWSIMCNPVCNQQGCAEAGKITPAMWLRNDWRTGEIKRQFIATNYTGYTFKEWQISTTSTTNGTKVEAWSGNPLSVFAEKDVSCTKTVYLLAVFTAHVHRVTLAANGGAIASNSFSIAYGSKYTALPTPVRSDGYVFDGWYYYASEGAEGVLVDASTKCTLDCDHQLTAKWKGALCTFDKDRDEAILSETERVVIPGDTYGDLPQPTCAGCDFAGWYDEAKNPVYANTVVTATEAHTLTAKWTAHQYTVTFNTMAEEYETSTSKFTYGAEYSTVLPANNPTQAGYTFDGWQDKNGNEIAKDDTILYDCDFTLYAQWKPSTVKVSFEPNGGSCGTLSRDYSYGNNYSWLPTPAKDDSDFVGWFTAAAGGSLITVDSKVRATDSQKLYAQWSAKSYTVTFNPNGGSVAVDTLAATNGYSYGELPTPTKEGCSFLGWYTSQDELVLPDSQVNLNGQQTLYAHWALNEYALYFVPGEGIGDPVHTNFTYDGSFKLPDNPGFTCAWATEFSGWKLDCGDQAGVLLQPGDAPGDLGSNLVAVATAQWSTSGDALSTAAGCQGIRVTTSGSDPVPTYEWTAAEDGTSVVSAKIGAYKQSQLRASVNGIGKLTFKWKRVATVSTGVDAYFSVNSIRQTWLPTDDWQTVEYELTQNSNKVDFTWTVWGNSTASGSNLRLYVKDIVWQSDDAAVPLALSGLVYNGCGQTGVVVNADCDITGCLVATNVGTYEVTLTLTDGRKWRGSDTSTTNLTWSIAPARFDITKVRFPAYYGEYDGKTHAISVEGVEGEPGIDVVYDPVAHSRTDEGTTEVTATIFTVGAASCNYQSFTNYLDSRIVITPQATPLTPVEIPQAVRGLVYNGDVQVGVCHQTGFYLDGNAATAAGDYVAVATPDPGYCWSDGSTASVTIDWQIGKKGYTQDGSEPGSGSIATNGLSKFDATYTYDGEDHTLDGESLLADFSATAKDVELKLEYSSNAGGPWSTSAITICDAGVTDFWYRVSQVSGASYSNYVHQVRVFVLPRSVTLTSGSQTWQYDGLWHSDPTIAVGGENFVGDEGVTWFDFRQVRELGAYTNTFDYVFKANTKSNNYEISCLSGELGIIAMSGVTVWVTGPAVTNDYDGAEHVVSGFDLEFSTPLYTAAGIQFSGCSNLAETAVGTYRYGLSADDFQNGDQRFDEVEFVIVRDGLMRIKRPDGEMAGAVGEYFGHYISEFDLELPEAGTAYTLKAEGLPNGLKLKQLVRNDPSSYCIEGVPKTAITSTNAMPCLRITTTVNKVKTERIVVLPMFIDTLPMGLPDGCLNVAYGTHTLAECWPEAVGATRLSGLPSGLSFKSSAISGTPKKAGLFTVTASRPVAKTETLSGAAYTETLSAQLLVLTSEDETGIRYVNQAYVTIADIDLTESFPQFKSVSGLPTGLKQKNGIVSGTPTKSGVFTVTVTAYDPANSRKTVKSSFLWQITPGENNGTAIDFGVPASEGVLSIEAGLPVDWTAAIASGAKVTVSGLPTGVKFNSKTGEFSGWPTKAGNYVMTVKTVRNGVTVSERYAVAVVALPAHLVGNYVGAARSDLGYGQFAMTISASGKVSGSYYRAGSKISFSATSLTEALADGSYAVCVAYKTNRVQVVETLVLAPDPEAVEIDGWCARVDENSQGLLEEVDAVRDLFKEDWGGPAKLTAQKITLDSTAPALEGDALVDEEYLDLKISASAGLSVAGKLYDDNRQLVAVSCSTRLVPVRSGVLGAWIVLYKKVKNSDPIEFYRYWEFVP